MAKTEFSKITASDIGNKGVIGLPDTPGLETEEMQKKFEEVVRDVVIVKFNEFIDSLNQQFGVDITAIGDGTVTGAISSLNSKLATKRCVVEERPVEFNNQTQVLIGSLSTLTGGLITSYAQVKGISVKTNGYIGVYVNAATNVYAYKTDIQPMTSNAFTVGLVIDYV